jgi:hypothetical protein
MNKAAVDTIIPNTVGIPVINDTVKVVGAVNVTQTYMIDDSVAISNNVDRALIFLDHTNDYTFLRNRVSIGPAGFSPAATLSVRGNIVSDTNITANGTYIMPTTTSTAGQIIQNGERLLHTYDYSSSGVLNLFTGFASGNFTTTGSNNIAYGHYALNGVMQGSSNVGVGWGVLLQLDSGNYNVALGDEALAANHHGSYNVAIGKMALQANYGNDGSTAIGYQSMLNADPRASGRTTYNTAVGYEAMRGSATAANNTGQYNTAVGYQALDAMTSCDSNSIFGFNAGGGLTTGSKNVLIGADAGSALTTESNKLYIENSNSATPLIWGDFAADSVVINGDLTVTGDVTYTDTYWDDMIVSGLTLAPGVNAPSLRTLKSGIKQMGYAPSSQNDISYGQAQFSHRMKTGTDIEAHIHYTIEEAAEAGDTVVVSLEYTWADIGEAFPTTDTLIVEIPVAAKTAGVHYLQDLGTITGAGGDNVSSIIAFTFTRLQDDVSDTYNGTNEYFILLDIDFHYEIDSPGSRSETLK